MISASRRLILWWRTTFHVWVIGQLLETIGVFLKDRALSSSCARKRVLNLLKPLLQLLFVATCAARLSL